MFLVVGYCNFCKENLHNLYCGNILTQTLHKVSETVVPHEKADIKCSRPDHYQCFSPYKIECGDSLSMKCIIFLHFSLTVWNLMARNMYYWKNDDPNLLGVITKP